MTNTAALTKRKALFIVLLCAAVLLLGIFLSWFFTANPSYDMSTLSGRQAFLAELGWEIDVDTEEFRTVVVPETLEGIMAQYNRMQQAQGYDLNNHLGESCQQYSYQLTNYPGTDSPVYVSLYIQGKELIAGDIHTNSLNGFMHGLKTNKS
jgi:hypothetical protein